MGTKTSTGDLNRIKDPITGQLKPNNSNTAQKKDNKNKMNLESSIERFCRNLTMVNTNKTNKNIFSSELAKYRGLRESQALVLKKHLIKHQATP